LLEQYEFSRDEGFGPEVKRRIMLGTYALSSGYYDAYYLKAQKVRTLIKQDFDRAFESVDVIATPTAPTAAFKAGEKSDDPLQMYLSDVFTISCNLAGLPGLSLPCGFTSNGLPIGLQLLGKPFDEETVFATASAYEKATSWNRIPLNRRRARSGGVGGRHCGGARGRVDDQSEKFDVPVVWTFPKGHLEPGETADQAARAGSVGRDGLAMPVAGPFLDVHYPFKRKGRAVDKVVHWFRMDPEKRSGEWDPDEVLDCRWVSLMEAKSLVS
jgi:hypothetical protein